MDTRETQINPTLRGFVTENLPYLVRCILGVVDAWQTFSLGTNELWQITSILDDCVYNILSDAVIQVHRDEKVARIKSATTLASQAENKGHSHGPILQKVPERKSNATLNPKRCVKHFIRSALDCNMYSQSIEQTTEIRRGVRCRRYRKKNTRSSSSGPSIQSSPYSKSLSIHLTPSVPSVRCTNCPRYVAATRVAQHLAKCLGLSERQSVRNARRRMASQSSAPQSRSSTPYSDEDESQKLKARQKRQYKRKRAKNEDVED